MRIYQKLMAAFFLFFTVLGCGKTSDRNSEMMSASDTALNRVISSTAAIENGKDSTRKFIRTADLKFKVKNVIESTYDIENITSHHGGFVTFTNLESNIDNFTSTAISADSLLETTYFTIENSMTLRVPNIKLDTTLKEIAKNIQYLDYRIIKADDVALNMLANSYAQTRANVSEKQLVNAIANNRKKLSETSIAENNLNSLGAQNDHAKISNLSLIDQINFSTIHLMIYEKQAVKRELVSSEKNMDKYEPGFGHKLLDSLKYGWNILATFILFLAQLWGLFLFSIIGYFAYKAYRNRRRNHNKFAAKN